MEIFPGISMDPSIRFGKPCLTGHVSMWRLWWGRWRLGRVSNRCRMPMSLRGSKFWQRWDMREGRSYE